MAAWKLIPLKMATRLEMTAQVPKMAAATHSQQLPQLNNTAILPSTENGRQAAGGQNQMVGRGRGS